MNAGIRLSTNETTFRQWASAMPGLALPKALLDDPADGVAPAAALVPPMVAASLALHSCAEAAILVRLQMADTDSLAYFAIAGDLCGSVRRTADQVEIGLYRLSALIGEVIRLVPAEPPEPTVSGAGGSRVQITMVAAGALVTGWALTLVGGAKLWHRSLGGSNGDLDGDGASDGEGHFEGEGHNDGGGHYDGGGQRRTSAAVVDVHRELATELRFALVDFLGGPFVG